MLKIVLKLNNRKMTMFQSVVKNYKDSLNLKLIKL